MRKTGTMMLILALSSGLCGQNKPVAKDGIPIDANSGTRKGNMLKEMTIKLNLDPNQVEKLTPICKANAQEMKQNRAKYKGKPDCLRRARFQNRVAMEEKMKSILTNEQFVKFEEIKKQKQEQRKKKRQENLRKPIAC